MLSKHTLRDGLFPEDFPPIPFGVSVVFRQILAIHVHIRVKMAQSPDLYWLVQKNFMCFWQILLKFYLPWWRFWR